MYNTLVASLTDLCVVNPYVGLHKMKIMKRIFYTTMFAAIASPVAAQTSAGNFMVGGNLLTTSVNIQEDNTGFNLAIQPKAGYFINDNLALGLAVELGINAVKSNMTMNYAVTPFARIFVGKKSIDDIPKRVMFFIEAGGGFGGRNSRFDDVNGTKSNITTNGGIFYVGPGIDIFLSKNVALELGAEYRRIGGSPNVNRVGINLGFQIFLSKSEAKKMYQEAKPESEG
jgi:hypothetical protein